MSIDPAAEGPKGVAARGARDALPYSHPVAVSTLHGETALRLEPDAGACARIAKALGLHALSHLEVTLAISHAPNGLVSVDGALAAEVQPICVITLDPFDEAIRAPVSVRFAPEDLIARLVKRAADADDEDFEPPDPIIDGMIDFGALTTEFLALALDPYPRKPGAAFEPLPEDGARVSPFDALKALAPKDQR